MDLIDLTNAPDRIEGRLTCNNNQLSSLKGIKHVGGAIHMQHNRIRFLDNDFVSIMSSLVDKPIQIQMGIMADDYTSLDLYNPISDFFRALNSLEAGDYNWTSTRSYRTRNDIWGGGRGATNPEWFERLFLEYADWKYISPDGKCVYKDRLFEFLMGLKDDPKFDLSQDIFKNYKLV